MSKHLPVVHFMLAMLMLLMLFLPLPWVSYGSGHYLSGWYFVLAMLAAIPTLPMALRWPSLRLEEHLIYLILTTGYLLSYISFAGGFVLLILSNLLSAALVQPWRGWLRRALIVLTLASGLVVGLTWPREPYSELFIGFWLAVGLVGIAGLIELVGYIKSRSKESLSPGS